MRSLFRSSGRFRDDERGSTLIEMALITPLMLSLSAGVFEFGNLIHKKLLIEAGLRDAARYAARCRPIGAACNTAAANIATTGTVSGAGSARVQGWAAGSVSVQPQFISTAAVDGSGNMNYRSSTPNVYTVRVSTAFVYPDVGLLTAIGIGPINLSAEQRERYIGW